MTHSHSPAPGPPSPRPPRQEQEPASEEITEVAPGIIRMQLPIWMPGLGHVNMYGLLDDRGLAVVDPGLPGPASWRALRKRLKSAGFHLRNIHTVIVTHSHPDHYGGAGRIADEAGARIVTHSAFITPQQNRKKISSDEAARLEREAAVAAQALDMGPDDERANDPELADEQMRTGGFESVPWGAEVPWGGRTLRGPKLHRRVVMRALRMLFAPPEPSQRVVHGERIKLAGREWEALHTPGHTLDHLCAWDPEHGVLLTGDHVLPSITPHVSGVGNGADALASYLSTLDLVGSLDGVRLGLPAHGHPFTDVPGRVKAIKEHHAERMEMLREASRAIGPASVEDLMRETFPERHWNVMAESETFAHLEHLALAGDAERWRQDDGRLMYRVAAGS